MNDPTAAQTPLYSDERRAEFPPGTTNLEIALTDALGAAEDEFSGLADDALQLCDQHISDEVRRETQRRIVERVQRWEADRSPERPAAARELLAGTGQLHPDFKASALTAAQRYEHKLVMANQVESYLEKGWEPVPNVEPVITNHSAPSPFVQVFLRRPV